MPFVVEVSPLREQGWTLPRFRSCMKRSRRGVVLVSEEHVADWNRTAKVARVIDARTGAPVDDVAPLYDVVLVCARPSCWTLNGIERIESGLRTIEYAQAWLITAPEQTEGA